MCIDIDLSLTLHSVLSLPLNNIGSYDCMLCCWALLECPSVLLIGKKLSSCRNCVHTQTIPIMLMRRFVVPDETFAPLDPASKSQVMAKLKEFCKKSIVLLIYHADVGRGISSDAPAGDEECIPSNSFFDQNLHVENKHLTTRPLC